jgi:hypothetical protein
MVTVHKETITLLKKQKMKTVCQVLPLIVLSALHSWAYGNVATFDDVPNPLLGVVPNGYAGLNWNMVLVADDSSMAGYNNGIISYPYIALNKYGNPAEIYGGNFSFFGAYFTGAVRDGLSVTAKGYRNGSLIYSASMDTSYYHSTWCAFNYSNIDTLWLSGSGGVNVTTYPDGTWFIMDNFTFNPVPEPATLLLLGLGGMLLRKHRG